jgi:hypothetical protein
MPHRWCCVGGDFQIYRYDMPTAFKRYFMPMEFNTDGVGLEVVSGDTNHGLIIPL